MRPVLLRSLAQEERHEKRKEHCGQRVSQAPCCLRARGSLMDDNAVFVRTAKGKAAAEDNDLDFTHLSSAEPAPQPTREQMADALNLTLPGMRELRSAGCYINIAKRPTQCIPPRSGDKYGVLIIDSDQSSMLLFARTLMLAGFNVRSAANREEVVAELNKPPLPDALLLDTALPGLNGLDVLARIHQHPQLTAVPIIVITSKLEREEVAAALARGASAYMIKPCMPEALRASVHAVLGLK